MTYLPGLSRLYMTGGPPKHFATVLTMQSQELGQQHETNEGKRDFRGVITDNR